MDAAAARAFIERRVGRGDRPELTDYIRIPNKSPAFDPDWAAHGYMDQAVALFAAWARRKIAPHRRARTLEVVRLEGRTPVILIEIPGDGATTRVLLYGHLDKQPEMTGWAEGLGPWTPVLKDDKLYGRGGADDGYAMFARARRRSWRCRSRASAHARCVILIEACEESGSYDLPAYVDHLAARIGAPSLVVCLDSGCGNYEQLWLTTSLRGMAGGALTVAGADRGRALRRRLAASCPPASASCASCSRGSRTRRPARSARRSSTSQIPPGRIAAGQGRRRGAGRRGLRPSSRSSPARGRWPTTRPS